MRQDGQARNLVRLAQVVFALPVCAILCCVAWQGLIWVKNLEGVEQSEILVYNKFALDTTSLPERPTLEDWYAIGWQLLQDNGWDLSSNLVSIQTFAPCGDPDPVLNKVNLDFSDAYFDGFIPCRKHGEVCFDRDSDKVRVSIEYNALSWNRPPSIEFTEVRVELPQALEIADRHGGREYRESLNDQCDVEIWLDSSEWEIRYRNLETSRWEFWTIVIDVETGEARLNQP
jgi:hypothetical protein